MPSSLLGRNIMKNLMVYPIPLPSDLNALFLNRGINPYLFNRVSAWVFQKTCPKQSPSTSGGNELPLEHRCKDVDFHMTLELVRIGGYFLLRSGDCED